MAYEHGIYVKETPTRLMTPVEIDSALPVVFGTAPVHNLADGVKIPVGEPMLIYSVEDFEKKFGVVGEDENTHDFTLSEFANVFIGRYGAAPVIFVNVFDPSKHSKTVDENKIPDVTAVDDDDILAAIPLVKKVYPLFRKVPGILLAPKYSATAAVAIALAAACTKISGMFRARAIAEIPDDGDTIDDYTEVAGYLAEKNLKLVDLDHAFGSPVYNGAEEYGSIHLAACFAKRDSLNDDVPFWSPSNYPLFCEGVNFDGKPLALSIDEAADLNGNGIVTFINAVGNIVAWGDQTSVYPTVTDVKDASIPIRRMFNWIGNKIILTMWQYTSSPLRRRLVNSVCDSLNCWLNGLTAKEYILGGRVEFLTEDNSTTDLMNGKIIFRVYLTPPGAAAAIIYDLEYDPKYLQTLFS